MVVIPPDEQLGRRAEQTVRHQEHLNPALASNISSSLMTHQDLDWSYHIDCVHLYSGSYSCCRQKTESTWAVFVFNRILMNSEGKEMCGLLKYIFSGGIFPKYT